VTTYRCSRKAHVNFSTLKQSQSWQRDTQRSSRNPSSERCQMHSSFDRSTRVMTAGVRGSEAELATRRLRVGAYPARLKGASNPAHVSGLPASHVKQTGGGLRSSHVPKAQCHDQAQLLVNPEPTACRRVTICADGLYVGLTACLYWIVGWLRRGGASKTSYNAVAAGARGSRPG
jgi:hypothetical protein